MPLIDTFTRRSAKMPLLDLEKMTAGLSRTWSGFLRDWDRSLRSGNYPETTRCNYLLAAAQLARYLGEYPRIRRPTRRPGIQAQGAAAVLQVAGGGRRGRPLTDGADEAAVDR
jgi:hypothetical protein